MIEVSVGFKSFIVPKASEENVRRMYYGKPEEKKLIIRPWPRHEDKAQLKKIVQKLK